MEVVRKYPDLNNHKHNEKESEAVKSDRRAFSRPMGMICLSLGSIPPSKYLAGA
jgi:hypothetical protein